MPDVAIVLSCLSDGQIRQDCSLCRNFAEASMCANFFVSRSAITCGGEAVEILGASTGPFSEQPHHGGTPLMSLAPYDRSQLNLYLTFPVALFLC